MTQIETKPDPLTRAATTGAVLGLVAGILAGLIDAPGNTAALSLAGWGAALGTIAGAISGIIRETLAPAVPRAVAVVRRTAGNRNKDKRIGRVAHRQTMSSADNLNRGTTK